MSTSRKPLCYYLPLLLPTCAHRVGSIIPIVTGRTVQGVVCERDVLKINLGHRRKYSNKYCHSLLRGTVRHEARTDQVENPDDVGSSSATWHIT